MAKIITDTNERVFSIGKWLGVNENPSGDMRINMGEATKMTNFKITDDGCLQIRPGSKNVAGLLSAYTISVASGTTTVVTDTASPTSTFAAYPTISVSAGGILTLSGTAVAVTYANTASYLGYYWQNSTTGLIYQIGTCTMIPPTGATSISGGYINIGAETQFGNFGQEQPVTSYSDIIISGGAVTNSGTSTFWYIFSTYGRYMNYDGITYKVTRASTDPTNAYWVLYGYVITRANETYTWNFNLVTATTNSSDTVVRGIWSGYVNGTEYIISACNGAIWSLAESSGVWTKTNVGAISTSNGHVHMFGFGKKLYILDGTEYRVWNGTTLGLVTGYRPIVRTETLPTGGGTELEQVNKLNGLREVWFSPNGTATTLQLPETNISSIDFLKNRATGADIAYTANLTTGLITLTAGAYIAGTDSIKAGYTVSTNSRSSVIAMKFSETYNGETDTRVFLYGDGSNTAFYSGLDYNGNPSAEYFPDLNVMAVDSANTPITGMIKHFDRLLTFKTDGAFITTYGTITLSDGSTTAGFYTTPLNREIGNVAIGQVKLVKNNPLTLFGRSVYEWLLSSYVSKDERAAKNRSAKVSSTLASLDLAKAVCFDDEFHTEYYIMQNGTAVVYNYTADAWYVYDYIPATCMINYKQEVYFGTIDGYIRHLSRDYMNDIGTAITAYWESGSMSFGADYKRKYSANLWVGIKPEAYGAINVTVQTDRQNDYTDESLLSNYTEDVSSGFFSFKDLDFSRFSFGVNDKPQMKCLKIKVKKFDYYKLIFTSQSTNTTATVTGADIRVRYTGNVR